MSLRYKVLTVSAVLVFASGHSSAQNPTMKTIMQEKLVNTQRMLESVVVADYMGMGRSAEALSRLSYTEIVSWQTAPQSEYVKQAKVFVMSVRGLQEAATKRDIDVAAKGIHDPHFQLHPMPHVRAALQTGVIRRVAPGLEGASS